MEHSGEIIKSKPHLVKQSPDSTTTALSLPTPSVPQWAEIAEKMATDYKQDIAPGQPELWKEKFAEHQITDQEASKVLKLWAGQFYPSAGQIVSEVQRMRAFSAEKTAELKQDLYWVEYERNNRDIERFMREHGGKTPQQVWCEENQKALQKLNQLTVGGIDAGRATVTKVSANRAVSSSDGAQGKSGHGANSDLPAKSTDEMAGVQGDVQPGGTGAKSL